MNAKHTPGPWTIWTSNSWRRICGADGKGVCAPITQRPDNHPDLYFPNGGVDGPDAKLLTAAPELLAALKALLPFADQGHSAALKCDCPRCEAVDAAEAAMANAGGR